MRFTDLNERDWCHWRYPLIEHNIERYQTWEICEKAGLSIIVAMYKKMGRFDCFWCGNQKPAQARKVLEHYPELAKEWMAAEKRKGHSFMPLPLVSLLEPDPLFADLPDSQCGCFGGNECVWEE